MPDPPPVPKVTRPLPVPTASGASSELRGGYAELHCKTNFTFLEGASHPDELVQRAHQLQYRALAITDRHSLAGVVRAHVAAKAVGLKLLIGAECCPTDGPTVVLLATDRASYGRLSRLLTLGRRRAPKGSCALTWDDIARHAEGLLALLPAGTPAELVAPTALHTPREIFGDQAYLIASRHFSRGESVAEWMSLADAARLPFVASNEVHYHVPERQPLQDVLTAIRHHTTVAELGNRRFANAERHLKSPQEMAKLFAEFPAAVARTVEIAERCQFSLDELKYEYPRELCPPDSTPMKYLTELTWSGARDRYPAGIPDKVTRLLEHELTLIGELRYEAYFLTVWDLVRFARGRGILCQGRGSAANSAVCYCLGVTSVNPVEIDLLFERFISRERGEAPDIDIDFEHERREEVLQYLYEKYGRDRAGLTATLITYRPRSAARDVGKALGLSLDRVDRLAKNLDHYSGAESLAARYREAGLDLETRLGQQFLQLTESLLGFPRHLSQHVGGMVMTEGPLAELVPIENAAMPGRTVIEWDKDDLDALGLLKVDCLCLGMLSAIRRAFALIDRHHQRPLTLASIPQDDPAVYAMIQQADTVGVFQIESRAQMSMLPRLKPARFYDLVIEVAIVRPGPIQGDMVHPYLRRRRGEEPVTFPDDRIREVLEKTLGVPLFQEQAMKLAIVAAGFTPGEADQLRRAMAAWKRKGGLEPFRQKLIDGMTARGYEVEFAERLYKQICGFGEYGFPESHAASFALLAYVSAWLKRYYPAAFCAALVNSQPMGFYAPAQLVADARRHGVDVRPPDVNVSEWECTLEREPGDETGVSAAELSSGATDGTALRLGFCLITGFSAAAARRIVEARASGRFSSIDDFARRTELPRAMVLKLARADALASLETARRGAIWKALPEHDLGPLLNPLPDTESPVTLPTLSAAGEVTADYVATGLSLRAHPFVFLRQRLATWKLRESRELPRLPTGQRVTVGGLVLLRQRPGTAKGVTFMTLEDEFGAMNLIVWPQVWERYRRIVRSAAALIVHGELQQGDGVIHVIAKRFHDLTDWLAQIPVAQRDFH